MRDASSGSRSNASAAEGLGGPHGRAGAASASATLEPAVEPQWRTDTPLVEVDTRILEAVQTHSWPSPLPAYVTARTAHTASAAERVPARVALAATVALGGRLEDAWGWAAACELLDASVRSDESGPWNATDRSARYVDLCGRLMMALAYECVELVPVPTPVRYALARALTAHGASATNGRAGLQALAGRDVPDDSLARYCRCAEAAGALSYELPVEGAALITGFDRETACEVATEFRYLATLCRLRDDVLCVLDGKSDDARPGRRNELENAVWLEYHRAQPEQAELVIAALDAAGTLGRTDDGAPAGGGLGVWREVCGQVGDSPAVTRVLDCVNRVAAVAAEAEGLANLPVLRTLLREVLAWCLEPLRAYQKG